MIKHVVIKGGIIKFIFKKNLAHPAWAGIGVFVAIMTLIVTVFPLKIELSKLGFRKHDDSNIHYIAKNMNRGDFIGLSFKALLPQEKLEIIPTILRPKEFFIDIQPRYKYSKELFYAIKKGIISVRPRYHPEEEINKKEMAVILSNIICVAINEPTKKPNSCANSYKEKPIIFKDLEDRYVEDKYLKDRYLEKLSGFKPYVNHLLDLRIIDESTNFYPNNPITKNRAKDAIYKAKKIVDFYKLSRVK